MSIAQNFFKETIDENGCLTDIQAHWPDNFNFGYDVVDAIAQETPDKRALVWCNTENEQYQIAVSKTKDTAIFVLKTPFTLTI